MHLGGSVELVEASKFHLGSSAFLSPSQRVLGFGFLELVLLTGDVEQGRRTHV